MITTIIRNATQEQLIEAREWVMEQLHVPRGTVTPAVAVGYIILHFGQGAYEGWNGFIAMREADKR